MNMPKPKELIQPPVCGNRFVEIGEQCDCGTVQVSGLGLLKFLKNVNNFIYL